VIHMSTPNVAMQSRNFHLRERFLRFASREPQLSFAPGRINIIGEIERELREQDAYPPTSASSRSGSRCLACRSANLTPEAAAAQLRAVAGETL